MDLRPVSDFPLKKPLGLPTKKTVYNWHHYKKYPSLVFKVGGKLFFDMDEWDNMARAARDRNVKEAQHTRSEPCNT